MMRDYAGLTVRQQWMAGFLALAMILPGAANAQSQTRPASDPFVFSAAEMAVEPAAARIAVRNLYGGKALEPNGGVIHLVGGKDRIADVASNGETQMLRHSVKAPDIRVIMTLAEGHYPILARKSAGINSLADLKGKRILGYRHTTAGYFLYRMLQSAGLSFDDVTIVETPLGKVGQVVANKEVDAIAIWEPDSEQALHALRSIGEDVTVFSGNAIYFERYNLNTTADALADPVRRAEIVRFVREVIDVTAEMNRSPALAARAQEIVAKSGRLYTPEEVAAGWPNVKYVAKPEPRMLDIFVQEELWLAAEEKRAPRSRDELGKFIDTSVYEEAMKLPARR